MSNEIYIYKKSFGGLYKSTDKKEKEKKKKEWPKLFALHENVKIRRKKRKAIEKLFALQVNAVSLSLLTLFISRKLGTNIDGGEKILKKPCLFTSSSRK